MRDGQFREITPEELRATRRLWVSVIVSVPLACLVIGFTAPTLNGLVLAVPFILFFAVRYVYDWVTIRQARKEMEREHERLLDNYRRDR